MARTHEVVKSLTLKSPTTTKAMEKYERKNKELTKNSKIKIQGVPLT